MSTNARHVVLGTAYGAWPICVDLMRGHRIVYSVGIGQDISWEKELLKGFDVEIHGFDPTPRSLNWLSSQTLPDNLKIHPVGLSDRDGVLTFTPPADSRHVSFFASDSALDVTSDSVKLSVKTLNSMMRENRHSRIDVLKMDIEGSEYAVIAQLEASDVRPTQLMVEFHHGMYGFSDSDTHSAIKSLERAGYSRFYMASNGRDQGFVLKQALRQEERGVIYFAFGNTSVKEANLSLESLRKSNPGISATLFTDEKAAAAEFDIVYSYNRVELHDIKYFFNETNRMPSLKVRFLANSPYYKTVHLDSDTYVKGDLSELFDMLDDKDFVLTKSPRLEQKYVPGSDRPVHTAITDLTSQASYSCAVFSYRLSDEMRSLLHIWWTQFVEKTADSARLTGNWGSTNGINEQSILHHMLADGSFIRAGVTYTSAPNVRYNAGMSMWPRMKHEGLWEDCRILHSHLLFQKLAQGKTSIDDLPDLDSLKRFL